MQYRCYIDWRKFMRKAASAAYDADPSYEQARGESRRSAVGICATRRMHRNDHAHRYGDCHHSKCDPGGERLHRPRHGAPSVEKQVEREDAPVVQWRPSLPPRELALAL